MRKIVILLSLFITFQASQAADFDIFQSGFRPLKLALLVSKEGNDGKNRSLFENVVINDLTSSQSFAELDPMAFLATPEETWQKVEYGDWRLIGADILAMCRLQAVETGWHVELKVHDPFRGVQLISLNLDSSETALRVLAHRVADQIYQAALGIPGYFTSHVLYVQKRGDQSDLIYMDHDGANRQTIGKNFTLLLSPDWSPDGRQVALNTYVGNRPRLEFFNLQTGSRTTFGSFKGLNSTPEFSPDGRFVAVALSYTGDTEVHIYDIQNQQWRQFTHSKGIDTTPTWSPDGKWIAFVSNRSGQPQVYRQAVDGNKAILVSTEGDYNTSPSWSPTGDRIAMISKKGWAYAVATVRPDGKDIRYLATGQRVESPTWAPNGQMILFSADDNRMRRVFRVPSWGGKPEPITPPNIDASDPAWSRR